MNPFTPGEIRICELASCKKPFSMKRGDDPHRKYCCRTCGARANAQLSKGTRGKKHHYPLTAGKGRTGMARKGFEL